MTTPQHPQLSEADLKWWIDMFESGKAFRDKEPYAFERVAVQVLSMALHSLSLESKLQAQAEQVKGLVGALGITCAHISKHGPALESTADAEKVYRECFPDESLSAHREQGKKEVV